MPPGAELSDPYYQVQFELLVEGTAPARLLRRRLAAEVTVLQQAQVRDAIAALCGVDPSSVLVTVTNVDPEISTNSVLMTVAVSVGSLAEAQTALTNAAAAMGSVDDAHSVLAASNLVLKSLPTITVVEATDVVEPSDPTVAIILGAGIPTLLICAAFCILRRKAGSGSVPMGRAVA